MWALGLSLAVMNGFFYLALERLALGVTVTIEVLGPLALAVITARRRIVWLWALVALVGVVALGGAGGIASTRSGCCSPSVRRPAGRSTSSRPRASGVPSRSSTGWHWR
nr:hypothetical protein [Microbacterium sp. NIBRBAC000506063]